MARYLGNSNKMEVHDLETTQTNCQIAEILPEHRVAFNNLSEAYAGGYDNCHWCIGSTEGERGENSTLGRTRSWSSATPLDALHFLPFPPKSENVDTLQESTSEKNCDFSM